MNCSLNIFGESRWETKSVNVILAIGDDLYLQQTGTTTQTANRSATRCYGIATMTVVPGATVGKRNPSAQIKMHHHGGREQL